MAELSGSLEDIGLTALVRFLADVGSTGLLTLERERAAGNLTFREGQIVAASFGSARGLDAVEAMAVALPNGWFVYTDGEVAGDPDPSLLTANVLARVDELARSRAARADPLSLSAVPRIVESEPRPNVEASRLSLDRAALRVLLAVDGRRSVGDLLSIGRPVEVIEHLRALAAAGVITFDAPSARGRRPDAPSAPQPAPEPTMNGASNQPTAQPPSRRGPGPPPADRFDPEPVNGTLAPQETSPELDGAAAPDRPSTSPSQPPRQNGASGASYDEAHPPVTQPPPAPHEDPPRPVVAGGRRQPACFCFRRGGARSTGAADRAASARRLPEAGLRR